MKKFLSMLSIAVIFTFIAAQVSLADYGGGGVVGGSGGGGGGSSKKTTKTVVKEETKTEDSSEKTEDASNTESSEPEEEGLKDVKSHWSEDYVSKAVAKGIAKGYEDKTFKPDNKVTRAEYLKMALVSCGIGVEGTPAASKFSDVSEKEWYAPYVSKAVESGVVKGYEDKTFKPNATINRAEMLSMAAKACKVNTEVPEEETAAFSDVYDADWYAPLVKWSSKNGVVNGYADKTFKPGNSATRAEAVKIILKISELL